MDTEATYVKEFNALVRFYLRPLQTSDVYPTDKRSTLGAIAYWAPWCGTCSLRLQMWL